MKKRRRDRTDGHVESFPVYAALLFAGLSFTIALADRAPIDLESVTQDVVISERFVYYWQGVVFRFFPGPYVYRVLVPYLIWGINKITAFDLISIDLSLKIAFLFGAQVFLYQYLRSFFDRLPSLTGVLMFDAVLGYLLSFIKGPSVIETIDILNVLILSLGLLALWKKRFFELSVILVIGLLNRETPVVLLPILLATTLREQDGIKKVAVVSFFALAAFVVPRLLIPTWTDAVWFNTDEFASNLPLGSGETFRVALIANARLLLLISPFLLIGFRHFDQQPAFLRLAGMSALALIVLHYFVGRVIETRLWIPVFPLLIPLVINNLVSSLTDKGRQPQG